MADLPRAQPAVKAPARPRSVLFACTFNAVRSPMAEAIARHYFGRSIHFASAGLKRGEPNGFAAAAMAEIGMDISRHRPRTFDELEDANYDLIVTLSPEAHHRALEFARDLAAEVVYWPTPDPTATHGSREMILDAYRETRERLAQRIKSYLHRPWESQR
ncbi:low molecular weight phosphatase family protein [Methylocystis bryophila]|uniref:Low molecular weight phosphatase family protein n=1 Tax=Methylocystis bryophila TaxID=655015 RepID=A0A1W6MYJ8_9HYPH|nr:arsenate reductase ArsC [Methylocystis bryophila]ARN82609.1 low molecular weight phosphatase family protein [Methylocystis bryophila]BDV38822.1 ArsC family transcriptional regulator [Methylocystis bryophila]